MKKNKFSIAKKSFSPETIRRLSLYLRNLKELKRKGVEIISSKQMSKGLNVSSVQFRKDLSYFGEFGKRGVGYSVDKLVKEIEQILGIDRQWEIALVGVGKLGSALLKFPGFSQFNLKITTAFDNDTEKIGKVRSNIKIDNVAGIKQILKKRKIKIAMICVPPEYAQNVVDKVIDAGIKAILNFAPVSLKIPNNVYVSNVDMACELESLIFFLKEN